MQVCIFKESFTGTCKIDNKGIIQTSAKYHKAVELLKRRYGKKNVIKKAHIQELMNVKPVTDEGDIDKLRRLYDTCETSYRGLKALGVDEAVYSSIVVPEVIAKLPDAFRLTITRGFDFTEWSIKDALNEKKVGASRSSHTDR